MTGVRQRLPGLDLDALQRWLAPVLELDGAQPLEGEVVAGGKSNLTYAVRSGGREWIVRRPPLGRRLPTAHSMTREHTVLRALAGSDVPVPRVVAHCDDETVVGAPFYVMERVHGRVLRRPADVDLDAAAARRCATALVRTLATLHRAPYRRLGLESFGRPEGFMARQMDRWLRQLELSRARPLPDLDRLGARLSGCVPAAGAAAVVHGDYRIDNVMLDARDPGRIAAVLDWEMATIGDPLADLGMLLMYWGRPGERFPSEVHAVTAAPGFLERDEVVAVYEAAAARPLEHLDFYVAFAHFKLAVIVEGIYARHVAGDTVGQGFDGIGEIAPALAAAGLRGAPGA